MLGVHGDVMSGGGGIFFEIRDDAFHCLIMPTQNLPAAQLLFLFAMINTIYLFYGLKMKPNVC